MFDSHGEDCRVPIIPEHYDRALCNQEDPPSVTLENTSGMQGDLTISEDVGDARFPEMCADWVLQKMVDGADSSEVAGPKPPYDDRAAEVGVPITRRERHL